MAKELPFFKFNATEWITGNISYEPFEIQGFFIRLCAEYWNRNNEMTLDDVKKRLNDVKLFEYLVENNYVKVKRNKIFISFLDEERNEIEAKYLKLSEAGRKGGLSKAKRRLKHKDIDKEVEEEIDKKKIQKHWNSNIGADGFIKD